MKLMILDGNSIVNRAFYGVRMLTAPDGTPTNGIYGFISILNKLLDNNKPDAVCVAFDVHAPTFRHKQYADYKGKRKGMPEELVVQMPILKNVIDVMGIKRYECEGWEADDILGTAGRICEENGWECLIVTGDKDSFQLITDTTHVLHVKTSKGQTVTTEYSPSVFEEEYGFEPVHIIDLKALMGDASDNIPGVAGVGEKTASSLIQNYRTVDYIYNNLEQLDIKESVRKKLDASRENAFFSYDLATIRKDVPVDFNLNENVWSLEPNSEMYEVFNRLGFNKFIEKMGLEPSEESVRENESKSLEHKVLNEDDDINKFITDLRRKEYITVITKNDFDSMEVCDGEFVYELSWNCLGDKYNPLLKELFEKGIKKVSHSIKDTIRDLKKDNIDADDFIFDTEIAAYLIDATESDYSIERLTMKYFEREISGSEGIFYLYKAQNEEIISLGMRKLMYDIEMPLSRVLADMENAGFLIDRKALFEYGQNLGVSIDLLQKSIWSQAGKEFNINSPKQLGTILFEDMHLPSGKKTKTGWSTSSDVLEKLKVMHPIVQDILDYRMLTKLKSTYADGLLKVISEDGRIHTNFQMTVTATGRLSSTEPNLQNIPVRKELGSEIRKMFIASDGNTLVDADYSQIELRLLAHIADDKDMIDAFKSGVDFHTVTASNVFNVPIDEVTSEMRSKAKAVNFGIIYGISPWSLANDIGVTTSEAKLYMDAYYEKYSGVKNYMSDVVENAKKNGFVKTLYNRRRILNEIKSSNFNTRSFGERVALNMPIQGTAADIIKLAMVNVYKRIKNENLHAKLILQVHDELIIECPLNEEEKLKDVLQQEMESVVRLSVPLLAETKSGHCWADAH